MLEAFVSVKDEGGPLFLQHTHALAQDAVSRSAFLSNIHAEAAVGELYLLGMDVEMVRAWMDAVQVDDKLLGHLSAQQLAATLTAADQLSDSATLREVCAAQRGRILALKEVFPDEDSDFSPTPASVAESVSSSDGSIDGGLHGQELATTCTGGTCNAVAERFWRLREALEAVHVDTGDLGGGTCTSPGAVHFCNTRCSALRWLEQLVASLSNDIAWILLREVVRDSFLHVQCTNMDAWLVALPVSVAAHAMRACFPCIESLGVLSFDIRRNRMVACLSAALPRLPELQHVHVRLPQWDNGRAGIADGAFDALMCAVCALPALRTLRLGLYDTGMGLQRLSAVVRHLRMQPGLLSLHLDAVRPGSSYLPHDTSLLPGADPDASASMPELVAEVQREAEAVLAQMQHLTALHLNGIYPRELAGVVLSQCVGRLSALQRLHVVDSTYEEEKDTIYDAAVTLPRLSELHLGAAWGGPVSVRRDSPIGNVAGARLRRTFRRNIIAPAGESNARREDARSEADEQDTPGAMRLTEIEAVCDDMAFDLPAVIQHVSAASMLEGATVRAPFGACVMAMLPCPDGGTGAALLQQSCLTALCLRGGQQQGSLIHDVLYSGAIGLRALRSLELSICTMDELHGTPHVPVDPPMISIATSVAAVLTSIQDLSIPLERLSLCGEYDDGRALAELMPSIKALTSLTRFEWKILIYTSCFDHTSDVPGAHHFTALRSLSTLRSLSLCLPYCLTESLAGYIPASGLTELRLHLGDRDGSAPGAVVTAVKELEQMWAPCCHAAAAGSHAAAQQAPWAAGMRDLRVLRMGVQDFSAAVKVIEKTALQWDRSEGISRLRRGIFIPADQAVWLESCGELQQLVQAEPGRLIVILG